MSEKDQPLSYAIEKAGLRIIAQKRIHLTLAQAQAFYAVHRDRPFFAELTEFMARCLGRHPHFNAHFDGDTIELRDEVNMGLAMDTERGLFVPVAPSRLADTRLGAGSPVAADGSIDVQVTGGSWSTTPGADRYILTGVTQWDGKAVRG